jgi:hypothetical protein
MEAVSSMKLVGGGLSLIQDIHSALMEVQTVYFHKYQDYSCDWRGASKSLS